MSPRILIAEPLDFDPRAVEILRTAGEVELRQCNREQLRAALREYDVIWFRLAHRIDRPMLDGPLRCRILATPVTGLDHIDLEACHQRGIEVVSLRGETDFLKNVRATAELTVALALALLRHIPQAVQSVRAGRWDRDHFRGRELYGKTAGIIGVGRLGALVAGYLRAFGMEVIGYDPRPDFPTEVARRVNSLAELLQQSDVVSIHVSYDAATRLLIGPDQLAMMKPQAILINTSRGGVIDEKALVESLQAGRIAGAAVDVLDGEPHVGIEHPLVAYARGHDNLLIVPHIGGNTLESFAKTECFLAGRVVEALAAAG
jgi:D-3-phosphoglycerate dehydrogenase